MFSLGTKSYLYISQTIPTFTFKYPGLYRFSKYQRFLFLKSSNSPDTVKMNNLYPCLKEVAGVHLTWGMGEACCS